jgi:hypothetical protein
MDPEAVLPGVVRLPILPAGDGKNRERRTSHLAERGNHERVS